MKKHIKCQNVTTKEEDKCVSDMTKEEKDKFVRKYYKKMGDFAVEMERDYLKAAFENIKKNPYPKNWTDIFNSYKRENPVENT